jgi:hypothetical protein
MAGVLRGEVLPFKHMPQVGTTLSALNLDAGPVGVREPAHGPRNLVIKAGPATSGIELAFGAIERSAAPFALVRTGRLQVFVFAGIRSLGAFPDDYPFFLPAQFSPMGRVGRRHVSRYPPVFIT